MTGTSEFSSGQDKTGGQDTEKDLMTCRLNGTGLEGTKQDWTEGLPPWTEEDWIAGDRTGPLEFLSQQDRTGGQETGLECRTPRLDTTVLEGKRKERNT